MFADAETSWAAINVKGTAMQKINLPFFYQLGACLHPLAQLNVYEALRTQVIFAATPVRTYVEGLLVADPSISVCRAVGRELIGAIDAVDEWFRKAAPKEATEKIGITDFQFHRVVDKAKEFETVLSHELATLAAFRVTNKGAYSTPELIEQADLILSESVRAKVPQEALGELQQAGRCLVLDSPTAAGFHMMRALEAVLYEYYLIVCEPKKKDKLESWAAYLAELWKIAGGTEGGEETSGDPQVRRAIAFLHQVKDTRNDIMHPELVLSADDAFGLLDVTKAAIIVMADRLPEKLEAV